MLNPEDIPAGNAHPSVPLHQEMLSRTAAESAAYIEWLDSNEYAYLLRTLEAAFMDGTLDEPHFSITDTGMSAGFKILWHSERFDENDMWMLADAFKDRVLELGYSLYMSDERHFARKDYAEVIQRHYLKPTLIMQDGKVDQRYGNIIIEYRLIDNAPYDLKFSVQYYHDHKYTYPLPYKQLLEALLQQH
jgi:hypothetical protein